MIGAGSAALGRLRLSVTTVCPWQYQRPQQENPKTFASYFRGPPRHNLRVMAPRAGANPIDRIQPGPPAISEPEEIRLLSWLWTSMLDGFGIQMVGRRLSPTQ